MIVVVVVELSVLAIGVVLLVLPEATELIELAEGVGLLLPAEITELVELVEAVGLLVPAEATELVEKDEVVDLLVPTEVTGLLVFDEVTGLVELSAADGVTGLVEVSEDVELFVSAEIGLVALPVVVRMAVLEEVIELFVIVVGAVGGLVVIVVGTDSLVTEVVTLGVVPLEGVDVTALVEVVAFMTEFDVRGVAVVEIAEKEVLLDVVRRVVLTASVGFPDD